METKPVRVYLSLTSTMMVSVQKLAARLTKETGIKHGDQDAIRWAIAHAKKAKVA